MSPVCCKCRRRRALANCLGTVRAGAGMSHPFMAAMANGLAERGIATVRYQFPYMEQGRKRPDTPKLAQATVRSAAAEASRLLPGFALVAGGKSFGGRMTSQAQATSPLLGVRGLVFLGFPLHPAGRPSDVEPALRRETEDRNPAALYKTAQPLPPPLAKNSRTTIFMSIQTSIMATLLPRKVTNRRQEFGLAVNVCQPVIRTKSLPTRLICPDFAG
jgi:hypothetical protein